MSQRSSEGGDPDDLDSPLLDDDEHEQADAPSAPGGVTLHGESVDLRHMLFGRTTTSSSSSGTNNYNTPKNNNNELISCFIHHYASPCVSTNHLQKLIS